MAYVSRAFPKQTVENPGNAFWTHGWNSSLLLKTHHQHITNTFMFQESCKQPLLETDALKDACLVGKLGTFVTYSSKHRLNFFRIMKLPRGGVGNTKQSTRMSSEKKHANAVKNWFDWHTHFICIRLLPIELSNRRTPLKAETLPLAKTISELA